MTTDLPHPTREQLAAKRILVVGDAMLDRYWYGAVDRISPEAPVPVVRITHEEERLGGAGNVALNVQTLGAKATLMTVVGADDAARKLQHLLARHGVEALLGEDPQLYTIVKLRVIGRAQQLIRVDFENQPDHEVLAGMLGDFERVLPDHDAVLFSDYGKGGLTHIPRMIELARAAGIPVLIDPKGVDYSRYAGATVITPNQSELAQVVGGWANEIDLHRRAHSLRTQLGLEGLLLTRSEDGMSLFDAPDGIAGHTQVAADAREVFDVTGAGDTVIATMAVMLAAGVALRDAMPVANRAGGIVVGKFGTASVEYDELFGS
ncbi:D-glycero-beta-D-manno-heptose-7-phosphate kinase [Piscinibacter sakaiensis]|uniref:D-glycero-beta-D-manno-heptose-7-phosphate kinase n=1 Tax=Piscinibacter sakaiensis TaxID=1547922 RepID=UPI003AAB9D2F